MINAEQLRAARALLDWSTADLARLAGLTVNGINKIERGHVQAHRETLEKIREIFEGAGLAFLENSGVQKRTDTIIKLEGYNDFKHFMDQVYEAATKPYSLDGTKPICICNLDNSLFRKHMKDYYAVHVERLKKLSGLQIRSLAAEVDSNHAAGASYLQYRYLKELKSVVAPFYVFGDKFALIDFDVPEPPKILLVHSASLAKSYRDQFNIMWNSASEKQRG
jgi:transcriptional regulator with XRE-family HTH domain